MFNALGNLGTQEQFFEQCGGYHDFDTTVCDKIGGYPEGAVLRHYDSETNCLRTIMSLKDNNQVDFREVGVDGENWKYVDDNPIVGVKIDYSDYIDISKELFLETGVPDLYEVPYDSYLQAFALGSIDCRSIMRGEDEDVIFTVDTSTGEKRAFNGTFFTSAKGASFLDVYGSDTEDFGSVLMGELKPYEWYFVKVGNGSEAAYSSHLRKLSPLTPFSVGIMLSKGDRIRIRNTIVDKCVLKDNGNSGSNEKFSVVHDRQFEDNEIKRTYLVTFANLYRRSMA